MNKRILIDRSRSGDRTRVAVTLKGDLIEYDESSPQAYIRSKNTIYNATIKSIRPELGAAFVQYVENQGDNIKDGFLPFANISSTYFSQKVENAGDDEVAKLIKPGQKILVQIKKDQLHHESKGAALTTYISLAGTYLVLLPLNQRQGISRKADVDQRDAIRQTLKDIHVNEEMGIIIRTAGISAKPHEIEWDYKALLQQWLSIQEAHQSLPAPCLIHEDENIVTRIIRDNMSNSTEKIVCNHKETYESIRGYLSNVRPEYLEQDVLEYYDHELMFDHYSVEDQVESIFQVRSSLPSGGQIVMHGTEAGYMIDVNSSKSTYGNNIEENALNTNKQAAIKIADMLRLRDVSGIIYIDFIDMNDEANRRMIERTFSERCGLDRANIKCEPISLLTGCMPVLRQGLGTVFFKSSLEPIDHDEAIIIGKRRSVVSYSNYMLCVIEKSATQKTDEIQIQLPVDVATYLLNEHRASIRDLEQKYQVIVKIIPNENFKHKRYIMKRFHRGDAGQEQASHTLTSDLSDEKAWISTPKNQTPHVSRIANVEKEQRKESVINTIWKTIFGEAKPDENTNQQTKKRTHRHRNTRSHGSRNRRNDPRSEQGDMRRRGDRNRGNQAARNENTQNEEKNYNSDAIQPDFNRNESNENRPKRGPSTGNRRRGSSSQSRFRKNRQTESSPNKQIGNFDDD